MAIGTSVTLALAGNIDTTIVSGPSGEITDTSVSFEFEATKSATFQCRLDSSEPGDVPSEVAPTPWQACVSPHAYTDLPLGPHSFEVRAKGASGGVDPSPAKATFFIVLPEPPPPETTIVTGPSGVIDSSEAVFTFSADGADEFECRLDLGEWIPCTSPQVYEGLSEGPHTFEVRARSPLGTVDPSPAAAAFNVEIPPPPAPRIVVDPGPPNPVAGVSFNAEPVDGRIVLICPGEDSSSRLTDFKQIPVGCLINARHGTINLTASKGSSGDTQAANFWGGVFVATQKAADDQPLLLKLAGRKMCERRKFKQGKRVQVRERRRRSGRRLWGSGKGNYKTRGNYGSATVRGTVWLVRDRCDGSTLFKVKEGTVQVRDFVKKKSLTLEAGESYIAKAKIPRLQFD